MHCLSLYVHVSCWCMLCTYVYTYVCKYVCNTFTPQTKGSNSAALLMYHTCGQPKYSHHSTGILHQQQWIRIWSGIGWWSHTYALVGATPFNTTQTHLNWTIQFCSQTLPARVDLVTCNRIVWQLPTTSSVTNLIQIALGTVLMMHNYYYRCMYDDILRIISMTHASGTEQDR